MVTVIIIIAVILIGGGLWAYFYFTGSSSGDDSADATDTNSPTSTVAATAAATSLVTGPLIYATTALTLATAPSLGSAYLDTTQTFTSSELIGTSMGTSNGWTKVISALNGKTYYVPQDLTTTNGL